MRTCKQVRLHFDQYIYIGDSGKTFFEKFISVQAFFYGFGFGLASSGRCEASPSLVKNTDSGKRHDKVMDSQKGPQSDGEKQSRGK